MAPHPGTLFAEVKGLSICSTKVSGTPLRPHDRLHRIFSRPLQRNSSAPRDTPWRLRWEIRSSYGEATLGASRALWQALPVAAPQVCDAPLLPPADLIEVLEEFSGQAALLRLSKLGGDRDVLGQEKQNCRWFVATQKHKVSSEHVEAKLIFRNHPRTLLAETASETGEAMAPLEWNMTW